MTEKTMTRVEEKYAEKPEEVRSFSTVEFNTLKSKYDDLRRRHDDISAYYGDRSKKLATRKKLHLQRGAVLFSIPLLSALLVVVTGRMFLFTGWAPEVSWSMAGLLGFAAVLTGLIVTISYYDDLFGEVR